MFRSNFHDVRAALAELGQTWNPRHRVPGHGRLGDEIANAVATAIGERTENEQQDPDGNPLAPLRPSTKRKKASRGYPLTIGVETHRMLAHDEILGRVHMNGEQVVMQYGVNEAEQEKAEYFQEGRPGVQARRPFYELGEEGEKAVYDVIDDASAIAQREFER